MEKIWGGERAFIELIKPLRALTSIHVIERKPSVLKLFFGESSGWVFEINAKSRIEWLIKAIVLVFRLNRKGASGYDVIYCYNHSLVNLMFACLASKRVKRAFVVTVHHIEKYQTVGLRKGFKIARSLYGYNVKDAFSVVFSWRIIKILLKQADAITVPSKATATDLLSLGFSQERIFVVSNGITHEEPESRPQSMLSKDLDGIYIGRLTPNKGIFDVLLVWKSVVEKIPGAQLAIVGDDVPQAVQSFIDQNRLGKNVIFFRHLSRSELSEALYRSKLLVLPTHTEGFCFTVGKALLHHVPAVVYDIPALHEVYGFSSYVKLIREGDVRSMSEEIVNLLSNDGLSAFSRGIEGSRLKLLRKYSWHKTANDLYRILFSVAHGFPLKQN